MIFYLIVVYSIRWWKVRKIGDEENRLLLTRIFDSVTFSGSLMLLLGIMNEHLLTAIGNTKPFLLVAGLAGFIYSLHALKVPPEG